MLRRAGVRWVGDDERVGAGMDFGEARALFSNGQGHDASTALSVASAIFWRADASKFSGASHVSNAARRAGQSLSTIANHAVSRLRPLTIICWRNTPSKEKPKRSAARLDGAFRLLHFHS